ncbi:MAG: aromatic ring-hydroxylating dioxygenase subunit alpha [Deltaproteobacteria bacterium]|nr:aromatic ring-hydroxylating dioxygenase subunit alpha [Deltaproteobacteria bacterium]
MGKEVIDSAVPKLLPAYYYCEDTVFQQERERILKDAWQFVARADQLASPGDFVTTRLNEIPVLIVRDKDKAKAFVNVCPHRGAEIILKEEGKAQVLMCHYHGWTWKLDGTLFRAPSTKDDAMFHPSCFGLQELPLEQLGPFYFTSVGCPMPWSKLLGELPDILKERACDLSKLKYVGKQSYDMNCNWKIVVENFLECYHCPISHPSFCDVINLRDYTVTPYRYFSTQKGPAKQEVELPHENARYGIYNFLWPFFMVNIYPGKDNASTNIIRPLSPTRTLVTYEFFVHPEMEAKQTEEIVGLIHQVQLEDVTICESVQRGLASGRYPGGRLVMSKENGIRHFQSLVNEFLGSPSSLPNTRSERALQSHVGVC